MDFLEEATTVIKTQVENEEVLDGSDSDESVETIRMSPIIAAQQAAAAGEPRRVVVVRRGSREQAALYGTEVQDGSGVLSPTSGGFPQRPQVAAALPTEVLVPGGEPLVLEFKVSRRDEQMIALVHGRPEFDALCKSLHHDSLPR